MIGSLAGSKRSSTGFVDSRGRATRSSFWRTSSAAKSMLRPQSNSSVTCDRPGRETEVRRWTPATTPTASSTGRVSSDSTSAGAAPGKRLSTVRLG